VNAVERFAAVEIRRARDCDGFVVQHDFVCVGACIWVWRHRQHGRLTYYVHSVRKKDSTIFSTILWQTDAAADTAAA